MDIRNVTKMQRESGQQPWQPSQHWDHLVVEPLAYLDELYHLELEAFSVPEDKKRVDLFITLNIVFTFFR